MKYEDFEKLVKHQSRHETIYNDSEGRTIVVIRLLDLFVLVTKAIQQTTPQPKREWVGLNWDDLPEIYVGDTAFLHGAKWAEAKLKEKNT